MSELICNELAKSYSHFPLYPTSFQLESGYLTVLAGKNGSGKSTLLRCLAGIDPACTGDVTLDGFSNWSMERYYTLMDRMNFSPSKQLWQLSKGEYMKMQTCFALAHHPRFLILDEPLEGFDPVFRKNFLSIMQDILNEDVGIFISSHITETLKKLADYLLFADNGIITFHCPEQMDAFLADKLKRSHTHIRDLLSRNS